LKERVFEEDAKDVAPLPRFDNKTTKDGYKSNVTERDVCSTIQPTVTRAPRRTRYYTHYHRNWPKIESWSSEWPTVNKVSWLVVNVIGPFILQTTILLKGRCSLSYFVKMKVERKKNRWDTLATVCYSKEKRCIRIVSLNYSPNVMLTILTIAVSLYPLRKNISPPFFPTQLWSAISRMKNFQKCKEERKNKLALGC